MHMAQQAVRTAKRAAGRIEVGGTSADGRSRAIIDAVRPCVDAGAFPIKRVVGETVGVEADIIADGHDQIGAVVRYRGPGEERWSVVRLRSLVNDLWRARFEVTKVGWWEYTVLAWIDHFGTWQRDLRKRVEAGQDVETDLKIGEALIRDALDAAPKEARAELEKLARDVGGGASSGSVAERARIALTDRLADLMWEHAPRRFVTEMERPLRVWVDRPKALCSAWYEMFPRSASPEPGRHGTFADVIARLPYVAEMGFDVLYLPPIHPIGRTARKGPNNLRTGDKDAIGSPWAIGGPEGGHKAIHPDLGTFQDFDRLVGAAEKHGLEIALDVAFQCSPDHPYVREHPDWFRHRPDGTIQYAENPPKKYEDIYPLDFECEDWQGLWAELKSVFDFWIERGVKIFRVDNPHTKSIPFWEWAIREIHETNPEVIFLSEAFTRPKRMYRLAKEGFTQSYTYFAWRNGPWELEQYMMELTRTDVGEFFRPNFWPNTPDILTEYLQHGGRPAAMARLVLAATLTASYGIYGPAYELCDFTAKEPGGEEPLDSEKYQLRHWNLDDPWSLRYLIGRVNRIRRENPALQQNRLINFHRADNPAMVAYSKRSPDGENVILCVVSTDPHAEQWGNVHLDLSALGVGGGGAFDVIDLLTDTRYTWRGPTNFVGLGPAGAMAHVFLVRPHERTERDFEHWH